MNIEEMNVRHPSFSRGPQGSYHPVPQEVTIIVPCAWIALKYDMHVQAKGKRNRLLESGWIEEKLYPSIFDGKGSLLREAEPAKPHLDGYFWN